MCRTKTAIKVATPISSPARTPRTRTRTSEPTAQTPNPPSTAPSSSFFFEPSPPNTAHTGFRLTSDTSSFVVSSPTSLPPNLRDTLPQNPNIYHFSEIHSATHNFLPNRFASSSSWRCTLRGRDVMVFRRKFRRRIETAQLRQRLSVICRSHHVSIINLLGASISDGQIYLVYEYVNGANLSDCLRNTHNPRFTVLSNWISRMQVATDIAHGLDYIHNGMGVNGGFTHHNRINSGGIIVTEPSLNAKLCHFGAAQLCGEIDEGEGEIADADADRSSLKPSGSSRTKFEGVRGYMSPEFQSTGVATQKSDVYAFGVVMLELLSGEEPLKYTTDEKTGVLVRTSVIETARAAVGDGGLRKWLDRRMKDSFPIEVAEKATRVALECVHVDPEKRPNMIRVAGMISKLYLESKIWSDKFKIPSEISVSLRPR